MKPMLISSGSPLEKTIGFSRAIKVGGWVAVSGTAPLHPDGTNACVGDVYGQTIRCLEIIAKALEDAGATISHTIRTRIMLTNISRWEEAAKAHGAFFADIRPACTFVQVSGFIRPEWLVEIEADAFIV